MNNAKQYSFKNTIPKFCFNYKILKLRLYMIKYRVDPISCLHGVLKKVKAYLGILNTKAKI